MTNLLQVELAVLGPLQVRQYGLPVAIPGAKPRAILTMLGLHGGSIVSAETLLELLWGDDPPRTATKALQTHISSLRRALGDGFVLTEGTGWILSTTDIDAFRYRSAAKLGRDAMGMRDASQAVARFEEALNLWRDPPELPDTPRGCPRKPAGSRAMPPWWRTALMRCLRRIVPRRSSVSSKPPSPTRHFARGVGAS